MLFIKFLLAMAIVFIAGEIVKKFGLPAIIGWLLSALFLGDSVAGLLGAELSARPIYMILIGFCQVLLGSMVGHKMVWRDLKDSIKNYAVLGVTDAIVTFLFVSGVFAVVMKILGYPPIIATLFGAIAIVTAPAPPVSLIGQYNCQGILSRSVPPMIVLNSILFNLIFFPLLSVVESILVSAGGSIISSLLITIAAPLAIGIIIGLIVVQPAKNAKGQTLFALYMLTMIIVFIVTTYINQNVLGPLKMTTLLSSMAASIVFVNFVDYERLGDIYKNLGFIHNYSLMIFIAHTTAQLDPRALISGGLLTLIYIVARFIGKYAGHFLGGKLSNSADVITKYLGIVMQPHSGVSIMYAGIVAASFMDYNQEMASIFQVTISAAAIIIELISLPASKKVYEKIGEMKG